ncbi:MAG: septum formation initiator family protein [Candidatus Limivivens sp.]|nr:septum formation initiator family protein [Candidatus Limivivens sp.]
MKRRKRKLRESNRLGMLCISLIVCVLLICLSVQSRGLAMKNQAYEEQIAQLHAQIEAETERAKEIEDLEAYMLTDEYIEDVARDKLGLVYEGETIFKPAE